MASLKGIKERINSIKTTRKITSAMKMVSSAKLVRAQRTISSMLPYSDAMQHVVRRLLSAEGGFETPLAQRRDLKRVAVVAFSSDSSLAGAFNSSVIKELRATMEGYGHLDSGNIDLYTVGKKVYEAAGKFGYSVARNFESLAAKPDYDTISELAAQLTEQFLSGRIDRVEVIYQHFKSAGAQLLTREEFLPISIGGYGQEPEELQTDYILEPSREDILETLLPQAIKLKLYTILLDSSAAEHAARVIAMQTATENADELISELTIEYNKSRQQAITNELLDIAGGQMN